MRHALIVLVMMFLVAPVLLEAQQKQGKARDTGSTKAQAKKDAVQENSNSKLDLSGLSEQLKKLVESGKLTEEEARKLVDLVGKPQPKGKSGAGGKSVDLEALGKRLKAAVAAGTMTEGEAIAKYKKASAGQPGAANKTADRSDRDWDKAYEQLLKNSPGLRQKVASGGATKEQVIAWMKQREGGDKGKGGKGKGGKGAGAKVKGGEKSAGGANFYAIVIGRLKTKDIELGEFTMEVDHVTSMYGSRWVKDEIVGQEVAVTGVSGAFRDQLLQIKRGQTLKVRSGRYISAGKRHQLTFAPKFHVLEQAKPFTPDDYGVPPKEFRGFQGVLEGKIVEVGGYEVTLRVASVQEEKANSRATKAAAITGKLVRLTGFYNQHEKAFKDLNIGDVIRVGARHADPSHDEFGVTDVLEKVK
jgi:polyhydroxyalkanoate synthesis regulator phasin